MTNGSVGQGSYQSKVWEPLDPNPVPKGFMKKAVPEEKGGIRQVIKKELRTLGPACHRRGRGELGMVEQRQLSGDSSLCK